VLVGSIECEGACVGGDGESPRMLAVHRPFNPPTALVGEDDLVTAFFERLGNLGVLLIAGALLLGGLAGAAVVHHYEGPSADSVASQRQNDKGPGDQKPAKNNGQGKQKHANKQHPPKDQGAPGQSETD
jgi:hypothetical protein